ncbi:MAG: hypothetical protein KKB31_05190 [Nanoarchaeota archaeon]|nr:hypothetical protein [Nanoarchaeota archaeon]
MKTQYFEVGRASKMTGPTIAIKREGRELKPYLITFARGNLGCMINWRGKVVPNRGYWIQPTNEREFNRRAELDALSLVGCMISSKRELYAQNFPRGAWLSFQK